MKFTGAGMRKPIFIAGDGPEELGKGLPGLDIIRLQSSPSARLRRAHAP